MPRTGQSAAAEAVCDYRPIADTTQKGTARNGRVTDGKEHFYNFHAWDEFWS